MSIGELAHRTGVSRRMLRHWDECGLVKPSTVDGRNGYRWYAPSQGGRVRAIVALRAVGFGLEQIGDLLDSRLTRERLRGLLRERERELVAQIDEASVSLEQVRRRLRRLEKGQRVTMSTLELGPLSPLCLAGVRVKVADEAEIGGAVNEVLPRLRRHWGSCEGTDVVLTYVGPWGEAFIEVGAGVRVQDGDAVPAGLTVARVPGADQGVTVRYDDAPEGVGDAWILMDAALEEYGLRMGGVYRQVLTWQGPVLLQAPVSLLSSC